MSAAQLHVRRMLDHIEQSYSEPITLQWFAADLHRQGAHLGAMFRREIGVPMRERLTRVRLDHAAALIRDGVKVEAVSMLVHTEPERPSARAKAAGAGPGGGPRPRFSRDVSWPDLDVLCLTAMHKDPQRRYATVESLIRDVDHYLAREPLQARPDTARYRLGKFIRRNRVAVIAGSLVVATVIGLVAFYTMRLTRARNSALAEAARTQRARKRPRAAASWRASCPASWPRSWSSAARASRRASRCSCSRP